MWVLEKVDTHIEPVFLRRVFLAAVFIIVCICIWLTQFNPDVGMSRRKIKLVPIRHGKMRPYKPKFIINATVTANSIPLEENKDNGVISTISYNIISKKKIFMNMKYTWKEPINFGNCAVQNCEVIKDRKRTDECDALLLEVTHLPSKLPRRLPHQIWVFVSHEPPSISGGVYHHPLWRRAFNMTMTFRPDSEFHFPWGKILPRHEKSKVDFDAVFDGKSKDIAWIVSNCHTASKREVYVNTLKKILPVDVYGRCGKLRCKKSGSFRGPDTCKEEMSEKYRFYLSFENSICSGYSTEKIFTWYQMRRHIIPVYRGSPDILGMLPPNTYVNAADFPNAKKLGEYLRKLGKDRKRYIAMLKAKDEYQSVMQNYTFEQAVCSVCAKLHEPGRTSSQVDLHEWNLKNGCTKPKDLL